MVHPFRSPLITASFSAFRSMAAPFTESPGESILQIAQHYPSPVPERPSPNRQMTARPDVSGCNRCDWKNRGWGKAQASRDYVRKHYADLHNALLHNQGGAGAGVNPG